MRVFPNLSTFCLLDIVQHVAFTDSPFPGSQKHLRLKGVNSPYLPPEPYALCVNFALPGVHLLPAGGPSAQRKVITLPLFLVKKSQLFAF